MIQSPADPELLSEVSDAKMRRGYNQSKVEGEEADLYAGDVERCGIDD